MVLLLECQQLLKRERGWSSLVSLVYDSNNVQLWYCIGGSGFNDIHTGFIRCVAMDAYIHILLIENSLSYN